MARAKKERAKYVAVIESLDQEAAVSHAVTVKSFSSRGAPGEKVEYEVYRSKPSFELGLTTEIYKESPLRVLPKCPHFASRTAAAEAAPCNISSPCSGGHEAKGFDGRLVAYRQSPP